MQQVSRQRGLTLLGFIMVAAIVVAVAIIALKLFPVYQEYYAVTQAMSAVANEPNVTAKTPAEIREMLFNRFYISYVESVKKTDVKFSRRNGYRMNVAYEVRKPMVGNVDVVAVFDKTVTLGTSGS